MKTAGSVFDFLPKSTKTEKAEQQTPPEPEQHQEQREQPAPQPPPRPTLRIVTPPEQPAAALAQAPRVPRPLPRRWDRLDPTAKASALRMIRTQAKGGARNVVISLILGLAGGPDAAGELDELITIDRDAAKRGYLTDAEDKRREEIAAAALERLRFDPLEVDGPCCEGSGWLHMANGTIERCDECKRLPDDDTAIERHAQECGYDCQAESADDGADQVEEPTPQEEKPQPPPVIVPPPPRALGEGIAAPLRSEDWAGLWSRVQAGVITEEQAREFGALWMQPRAQA